MRFDANFQEVIDCIDWIELDPEDADVFATHLSHAELSYSVMKLEKSRIYTLVFMLLLAAFASFFTKEASPTCLSIFLLGTFGASAISMIRYFVANTAYIANKNSVVEAVCIFEDLKTDEQDETGDN
jgi:uncharacterized membrane-anchored protein